MSEYLTQEEMTRIQNTLSQQKGQNYPCSNQTVICAFVGTLNQWNAFIEDNKYKLLRLRTTPDKRSQELELFNHEKWKFFNINRTNWENMIGYRFYKLKISVDVYKDVFYQHIYPLCSLYCSEVEFIEDMFP